MYVSVCVMICAYEEPEEGIRSSVFEAISG